MPRRSRAPDFRYVWLTPGPSAAPTTFAAACVGMAACGLALSAYPQRPMWMAFLLGAGAAWAAALGRTAGTPPPRGAREVAMAIVPWGVVVDPDTAPRVFRWPAVRSVTVQTTHTLRGGTPSAVSSLVTVRTDREALAGRAFGAVELEQLLVDLPSFAEESQRPVAADLEGDETLGDAAVEAVFTHLLHRAHELCFTARGATRLLLPAAGYRRVAAPAATPETVDELRAVLSADLGSRADPRPLAALVAGLLGARALVPDLVRLSASPHPAVAAAARASALRLGGPANRVGAVDEVAAFLSEEDVKVLEGWCLPPLLPLAPRDPRDREG